MAARTSIPRMTGIALLAGGLSLVGPASADSTTHSMRLVYAALSELLPVALDGGSFDSAEGVEVLESSLAVLERSAHVLADHAGSPTAEFSGLARSFESNVVLLRQSLDLGRYHEFSYLALDLTQNCVSCHALLPADSGPDFAGGLIERVEDRLYSELDLAQLQMATRQFDAAMATLEGIIGDAATEPLDLELDGVLFDYLNLGVGVTGELERVAATLSALRLRPDMPYYMARYAGEWLEHAELLKADVMQPADLDRARHLFDESLNLSPIPSSQVRVIYDLVVSGMLRRLLEAEQLDSQQQAEAYWMLGAMTIRTVNPRPGVPHTELLLDAAIRANPGSDIARRSYALLEEYNRVSFYGIPTAELPEPVLNLDKLRELAGIPATR